MHFKDLVLNFQGANILFREKLRHSMVPDLYFILRTGSKGIKVKD